MNRACILFVSCVCVGVSIDSAWGSGVTLRATLVREAGDVYVPTSGTVSRYVTTAGPSLTLYEPRTSLSGLLGEILETPDLVPPFPAPGAPSMTSLLEPGGGAFGDPTVFHPHLLDTPSGLALFVIDNLPFGTLQFFLSSNQGASWIHQGSLPPGISNGGSGLIGAIAIPEPTHAEGVLVRLYHQSGGGDLIVSQSAPSATGAEKYFEQEQVLSASFPIASVPSGLSPTGGVFLLADGSYGLFYVPQDDSYLGFAESPDGLSWTITRGASNPILSTSLNVVAPDPSRPEINEVSLTPTGNGFAGYFTGSPPGFGPLARAVGSIQIEFGADFLRGDCTLDGQVDLADAQCQLEYLFLQAPVACLDAVDTDDNGTLNLSDPVKLLSFLFGGGAGPAVPNALCDTDPTSDLLPCFESPAMCP